MTDRVGIPINLQNDDFRFIKITPKEKTPFEPSWQKKNNYAWNDPELWEHLDGGGNYGVVCGYGGLVVVDADMRQVERAVGESLPKTFTVRTGGGGRHFYYICKDLDRPIRLKEEKEGDLGDIQYTGKQVVGPNSIHPNGKKYEVEKNLPIREISAEELRFALKDFLKDESTGVIREEREALEKHGISDEIPITDVVPLGGLKRRGEEFQGPHPIHGSTGGHNFTVNPRENVWHCFRHGTGGGSPHWIAVQEGIIECSDAVKGALDEHKFTRVLKKAVEKGLISKKDLGDGLRYREKGKFVPKLLADEIMGDFNFITLEDTEEIFVYQEGVYRPHGETLIRSEAQARLGKYSRTHYQNEVVNFVRSATYTPRSELDKNPHVVVVKNGSLDVKNRELKPHSPDPPSTVKIPVKYDPDAECPEIEKFLGEILNHDDIPTIQEGVGYCLLKDHPIATAFMLIGSGANGKSTLLNLITRFLGEENVATPSLQDLLNNRFAKAGLYGKMANIHADIPAVKLESTGAFKMLTGQDLIYGEKKFRSAFTFKNHAKLWYSANELPFTSDRSNAFFERWILLDFPNYFPKDDPETDPHLINKIATDEELSGLLNWALDGLHRLFKRGHFTKSKSREEVEAEWILQTDSIRAFVMKRCKRNLDSVIVKSDFYHAYLDFCDEHGLSPAAQNTVGRRLPSVAPYVRATRPEIEGKRERCWKRIEIYPDVRDVRGKSHSSSRKSTDQDSIDSICKRKALKNPDMADVRDRLHELLPGLPMKTEELFAYFNRSDRNRVEGALEKMAEEGQIFGDKNGCWKLTDDADAPPTGRLRGSFPEFEREITQKLLWDGAMTVEEIRSELDIEDTQFNEAFNRLAERGTIVQRGGKWVHRGNILGEP